MQVRHALGTQFKERSVKWSEATILRKVTNTYTFKDLITFLYDSICDKVIRGIEELPCKRGWVEDVEEISDEQGKRTLEIGPLSTLSPPQSVIFTVPAKRI